VTIFINTLHLQRYFRSQSTVTTTDYIPVKVYFPKQIRYGWLEKEF